MELILIDLKRDYEELKLIIETPRMSIIYICDHFSDLKSQVDLAYFKKDISTTELDKKIKLKENWIQIILQIEQFEKECLKNLNSNFNESISKFEIIEKKLKNINNLGKNDLLIEELNDLTYDEMINIQRKLFLNKTMVFLEKSNCTDSEIILKIENDTTIGYLLVISNEYFGKKAINYLKNNETSIQKITNELLRCKEFKNLFKTNKTTQEINLNNNLTKISLSNSQLKSISSNIFHNLSNLKSINLSRNMLTKIDACTFNGLFNLRSIYLYNNEITSIDSQLFKDLKNLNLLMISTNQLKSIETNTFYELFNLAEIDLAHNKLTTISGVFNGLFNLRELRLSCNQISKLDSDVFKSLINLKEIYLDGNLLTCLDFNLFNGMSNLVFINLARNLIDRLEPEIFNGLYKLVNIILSQNPINIDQNLFKKFPIIW